MESSNEVTLNSSFCWECRKMGLNSGLGIIVICTVNGYSAFYIMALGCYRGTMGLYEPGCFFESGERSYVF